MAQSDVQDIIEAATNRGPVTVPQGILPDSFQPLNGSVYDSFAEGLPPVIFVHDQFFPLTAEELDYLSQSFAAAGGAGGPEQVPAMPNIPTVPDAMESAPDARMFETAAERAPEKPVESTDDSSVSPATAKATAPTTMQTSPAPEPIVDVSKLLARGQTLVQQETVESAYDDFRKGRLKTSRDAGDESVEWLRTLLLKLFTQELEEESS